MKALVLTEFGEDLQVMDADTPTLPADGALIRVKANGICRSDWHLWQGDWSWLGLEISLPHVLGHEFAGVIEAVGPNVTRFAPGDRVMVPHAHGCGTCEYCLAGYANVCANVVFAGTDYWGGYGEYSAVPGADRNLVALPDEVSFEAAAGLGCRFMTAWHGIVDQVAVQPGEWVMINGCGGLGLSAVQIAKAIGASVIAVDIQTGALDMAKRLGADHVLDSSTTNVPEGVRELTHGGAHVSVDALGIAATCQASIASLRKRGRHLQAGLTSRSEQGMIALPIDAIALTELTIVGCANMPISRFPDMMRMVQHGIVNPASVVTRTVNIAEAAGILQGMGSFSTPGVYVVTDWS